MEYRDRLKTARVNRGYSQGHLAHLSGVKQPTNSRIEHGFDADDETREKLAAILPELIGGEAPAGVSQMLSMKLNSEAENKETKGKDENMEDWISKAVEAFNAPQEQKPTTVKAAPPAVKNDCVSELARAIVERDVYKALYERLLDRVLPE